MRNILVGVKILLLSVLMAAGSNAMAADVQFYYDTMYGDSPLTSVGATKDGVTVSSPTFTISSKTFCGSVKHSAVQINSSASNDVSVNYYGIESTSPISEIKLDIRVVGSTTAADVVVLAWEDTPSGTFTEAYLVSAPGYGADCNTEASDATVTFASSKIKYVRIYRRIKVDNTTTPTQVPTSSGSNYGGGTSVGLGAITVTTSGVACSDTKPSVTGTLSTCAASTTLTASGATSGATYQWYKDGSAISGATSSTYSATESGSYKVSATKNCTMTSDAVTVSVNPTKPDAPTITQSGNKITITGTGGDVKYSLDGGSTWTTATSFSITQDEVVKAKVENNCYESDITTYSATWTEGPTCGVIGSDAGDLSATKPYDFGDFKMYHGGNKDDKYATSTSNLCSGASKRYYMTSVIVELVNYGASQINILGQASSEQTITSVEIADALDGTYTTLSTGTTGTIGTDCSETEIPSISAKQGKFVKITFSGEVRVSGICVTPLACDAPTINASTTTIYNCGTNNNVQLTLTKFAAGDDSDQGTWSSSDTDVATVDASGKVTAVAVGQVNIIFTPTNTDFCATKKIIKVSEITLTGSDEVGEGNTIMLTPNVEGGTYKSSKTSVATVSSTGVVTGVGGGTATITYTVNGCSVTKDITVLPNLSVISAPVLSTATTDGFTASWTASTESGVNGYILHIYNASTGAEVKTITISGQSTTSAVITGLDAQTQYNTKIEVQGNGSTTMNSDLSSVSNSITTLKDRTPSACISEDFSILTDASSCPTGAGTSVRSSSGCADDYLLNLSGGTWTASSIRLNTSGHSGYDIYFYPYNSGTPSLTLPATNMPLEVSFYAKAASSSDVKNTYKGFQVLQDGNIIKTGITVDGKEMTESSDTTTTAGKTVPQLRPNGIIQVSNSTYQLITVTLTPSNGSVIKIQSVGGQKYYVDDVTVKCDPMELIITPDLNGLSYVKDLGPSDAQDITISGKSLPIESGTATLSGVDEFEISLDNGVTWTSGGTVNVPYTNGSFAKTIKVRLPKDMAVGTYSDVFMLSATGYTKPSPSVTVDGEVTLFPIVLNCGQAVDVLRLMTPGVDTDNPSFTDLATGTNWTTSGDVTSSKNALGAYAFKLAKSGMVSPSINANNYDFLRLTFDVQPSSASDDNKLKVQVYGTTGYIYNEELTLPAKEMYHETIDLQSSVTMGNYSVVISSTAKTFYVTNIVMEGTAKRKFNFEAESLDDFQSYPDCPSDVKEITVYGTCLDDDKSLDFTSYKNAGNEKYEFSADGTTGWSSALSIPYTGEFPLRGLKVYARQKQGLDAGSVNDVILVQNGSRGSAFITLSGQAASASTWYPANGTVYNFSSVSGQSAEFAIPFSGGPFCADPVVSASCSGVTLSNCKEGTYATSTTIPASVSEGSIYVKYTPGTLSSCAVKITAAGETRTVYVNWDGGAAVTTGVQLAASSIKVPTSGAGTVQATAKGTDMNAQVTITSEKFDVSMGNPSFGDFSPITTTTLGNMTGTLYVRPKAGSSGTGTVTISTDGGTDVVLNCTIE